MPTRRRTAASGTVTGHYVYMYRDAKGSVAYVGYGAQAARASQHQSGSHNAALEALLDGDRYSIEIAGPFDSEEMARAVETALVAVVKPSCNVDPGQTRWRFRPLGVPERFADRLLLAPLDRPALRRMQSALPMLLVRISAKPFDDERVGYTPERPPPDAEILERMDRYWLLGDGVDRWGRDANQSPRTLVGIIGRPGAQIIIGAVAIARQGWPSTEHDGAFVVVPTSRPVDLDAHGLRGRRLDATLGVRFGSWPQQTFCLVDKRGKILGGWRRR